MWKHFHRYGVFATQFADKLALIDNDVSLTTAFNEKFLLKHGSTTVSYTHLDVYKRQVKELLNMPTATNM